jgi:hypothetical protein
MGSLRLTVILVMMVFSPNAALALEPGPSSQQAIKRAVFAEGKVWALSDAGDLFTITEGKPHLVEENLPEPALDLCVQNGDAVVISCSRGQCQNWTVRRHKAGGWSIDDSIDIEGDKLIGLECEADRVSILTSRRLIESSDSR